jgi:hypothetical protein
MKKFLFLLIPATLIAVLGIAVLGPTTVEAQPLAGYCCDGYGNRRCVLENAVPAGNSCFCFNQGYGVACY